MVRCISSIGRWQRLAQTFARYPSFTLDPLALPTVQHGSSLPHPPPLYAFVLFPRSMFVTHLPDSAVTFSHEYSRIPRGYIQVVSTDMHIKYYK